VTVAGSGGFVHPEEVSAKQKMISKFLAKEVSMSRKLSALLYPPSSCAWSLCARSKHPEKSLEL
jgi:hypothetical protein